MLRGSFPQQNEEDGQDGSPGKRLLKVVVGKRASLAICIRVCETKKVKFALSNGALSYNIFPGVGQCHRKW